MMEAMTTITMGMMTLTKNTLPTMASKTGMALAETTISNTGRTMPFTLIDVSSAIISMSWSSLSTSKGTSNALINQWEHILHRYPTFWTDTYSIINKFNRIKEMTTINCQMQLNTHTVRKRLSMVKNTGCKWDVPTVIPIALRSTFTRTILVPREVLSMDLMMPILMYPRFRFHSKSAKLASCGLTSPMIKLMTCSLRTVKQMLLFAPLHGITRRLATEDAEILV
mmetsp:Transcript_11499/g.27730  ORF Transcript_11499/g.27730 Transcript_11499/m.27730 type:complete len:225 (-) Transcript_11499:566-1240(-)